MKKTTLIFLLIILGIPLYAQEIESPARLANMLGLPVVCDSSGIPVYKFITIVDSTYGGIKGWCVVELFTKEDSIHVDNVKFLGFHERGEIEHDSALFQSPTFVECVQKAIHEKLYHGYIVYPDHGEGSKRFRRNIWSFRIVIESQFPKHP